jgi:hypothetical protein
MRVLLDTSILISASRQKLGNPHLAFLKAVTQPNQGVVCDLAMAKPKAAEGRWRKRKTL